MRNSLLLFAFLVACTTGSASHITGGQIDYRFTSTGQLVVSLHVYRECDGLPLLGNTSVYAKSAVGNQSVTIPVTLYDRDTIALRCYDTAQSVGCQFGMQYMEVIHYQSVPVTLSGMNFAQGFTLRWVQCCLTAGLENLTNPMADDLVVRTVVTPPRDSVGNPVPYGSYLDNGPLGNFLHLFHQEVGKDNRLELGMLDADGDSLYYAFSHPMDEYGNPLNLSPGYSAAVPFSNPVQNGSNVPPLMNPYTGTITYTAYSQGYFYYEVAIESWRGDQLLSTSYRPQILRIVNNSLVNNNPAFSVTTSPNSMTVMPLDSSGLVYGAFGYPGDSLSLSIQAVDFDFNGPNFLPQLVTLQVSGSHLGNPLGTPSGCIYAPCGSFLPTGGSMSGVQVVGGQLKWQLDSAHLAPINGFDTKYILARFDVVAADDACGLNGRSRLQLYVLMHNGDTSNAVVPGIGLPNEAALNCAIFPNPVGANGFELVSNTSLLNKELVLYNNQGQVVARELVQTNEHKLHVSWANHLPNGLYFLSIGGEITLKLVK